MTLFIALWYYDYIIDIIIILLILCLYDNIIMILFI